MSLTTFIKNGSPSVFRCFSLLVCIVVLTASSGGLCEVGEAVIRVKPGTDIEQLATSFGFRVGDHVDGTDIFTVRGAEGQADTELAKLLKGDPRVSDAEPNEKVTPPELGGGQLHYPVDRTMRPIRYRSQQAYSVINLGTAQQISSGRGVVVAVLDTGVALDHPYLVGQLVPGFNAISPGSAPADVADGSVNGAVGHGTMVAGVIARIAPEASIMPVRVLNADGVGTVFSTVRGIRFAVDHGAKIINLSLGSIRKSSALEAEISRAKDRGVLVVASAGNEGQNLKQFPAGFGDVIAVASLELDLSRSPFSNYGSHIVVGAPGNSITSTYFDGGFATSSGTSFAAPMVSGQAALILAIKPSLKGGKVKELIEESANSVAKFNPPLLSGMLGRGVINVEAVVKRVARLSAMP